ncbi:uncharacterized protein LOC120483341 [Pimephales promelas]|uniref:uncharacterized protein LOC120483341 n=1 Tax=Pimephales promelas TaxID=90988 RepID=UPI001955CA70|nr:uncharacterized protein LOC120483341 [Pimephales promelas]
MKVKVIFPGKIKVCFRKGPTGYLRQDPSDEAKRIKDNPNLQDKSAPQREDKVKENARSVVFMRGGDVSDRKEVLGEYVLQFGKYKGKSFRWLLENDVGYTIFLTKKVEEEERAGQFKPEGPKKDSLLSFLEYSRSFQEIEDLLKYLTGRSVAPPVRNEDDNLVGFGINAEKTWRDVWESRADGYAAFILQKQCVPGSKMYRLQQYLTQKKSQLQSVSAKPASTGLTPSASHPLEMEDDEELERMMLSISPSKLQGQLKVEEGEELGRMMLPTISSKIPRQLSPDESHKNYPEVFTACAVTRSMTSAQPRDGILVRKWIPHGRDFAGDPVMQVVVPEKYRSLVLQISHDKLAEGVAVYLDDVIVFSDSWEQHLKHIIALFSRFEEAGLTVNLAKCEFAKGTVTYLGPVVAEDIGE